MADFAQLEDGIKTHSIFIAAEFKASLCVGL
jgi:hypothetical protein